nr:putative holin [Pseudomonas sp. A46]
MPRAPKSHRTRVPRMSVFTIITLILLLALAMIRPEQLQVVVYKAGLVTLGAVLGYWIDRSLFLVEARPHECIGGIHIVGAWVRRAMIVLACILGLTLGL